MNIKDRLKESKLLFDGAFGTYYADVYDTKELPEKANIENPQRTAEIHKRYIDAGADIIRTNTFACNTVSLDMPWTQVKKNIKNAYRIAYKAAENKQVYVAADIGEIPFEKGISAETISKEYTEICRTFLEEGADIFVFETMSDIDMIREAIEFIGDRGFIIVQFSVNQYGYTNSGLSARMLAQRAEKINYIDAVGFNCGVGPGHMRKIINGCNFSGNKFITALPNSGYPQYIESRMIFDNKNIEYFVSKISDTAEDGVDIIGGCCGTTPEYIQMMRKKISFVQPMKTVTDSAFEKKIISKSDSSFFAGKSGKKLIAVELAPPLGSNDTQLMDAAHLLKKSGADVLTFPDSPSGRTRADSILMAEKVSRETGLCVMPHICCRDKNAIAMRSQILGAYINKIRNFLVITGDPIPSIVRGSVKSVFNFDSVGLMRIIQEMSEDFDDATVCYGGAINQGRRNITVETERVKKKMLAGATFFFTQPVLSKESAERVRFIKQETGARILCGIMPFVSLKNAMFMKNEMTGIDVTDEVLARFHADMTREEGEEAGIKLAKEMMALTDDFADGYYFSFPFNRVHMLEKILND